MRSTRRPPQLSRSRCRSATAARSVAGNACHARTRVTHAQASNSHSPAHTRTRIHTCASQAVTVDMMHQMLTPRSISDPQRNVFYAEVSGQYRAVRLPFNNSRLSAIAVLPSRSNYGLDARAAAAAIRADVLLASRAWLPLQRIGQLKVQLPRFSVRTSELALTQVRARSTAAHGESRLCAATYNDASPCCCTCCTAPLVLHCRVCRPSRRSTSAVHSARQRPSLAGCRPSERSSATSCSRCVVYVLAWATRVHARTRTSALVSRAPPALPCCRCAHRACCLPGCLHAAHTRLPLPRCSLL